MRIEILIENTRDDNKCQLIPNFSGAKIEIEYVNVYVYTFEMVSVLVKWGYKSNKWNEDLRGRANVVTREVTKCLLFFTFLLHGLYEFAARACVRALASGDCAKLRRYALGNGEEK